MNPVKVHFSKIAEIYAVCAASKFQSLITLHHSFDSAATRVANAFDDQMLVIHSIKTINIQALEKGDR